ncbi:MAG: calcium-binding EGF-like domain-containing protein [Bacteroidetes bacterium]|nr:calcium-binding EGF-like domain-containing protein [Bacteroidota bacterium]
MNKIKNIAFSALLAIGTFGVVTFTACTKDECKDVVCQNGGTCVSGACVCATGYEGTNCEIKSRDKFIGTYTGNETCTVGTDTYTVTIASNSDEIKITLTNIYNQGFAATGTITGTNTFTFSGTSGTTNYNGTGTLATNQLTLKYHIGDGSTSNDCTFVGNK